MRAVHCMRSVAVKEVIFAGTFFAVSPIHANSLDQIVTDYAEESMHILLYSQTSLSRPLYT